MTDPSRLSTVGHELLDDPGADPALVRESLRHLARSNAWFGGLAAARTGIERVITGWRGDRLALLDVGTGAGDIPRALGTVFAARGIRLASVGIDRHRAAAPLARAAGVPTIVADGFHLPFADRSVDVVLVSQVAHHFSPAGVVSLAREVSRVARIGVVIADLTRSRLAQVGFGLGSRILGFDRVTRIDGITSLARGFRPGELGALLDQAGVRATISTHLGSRIVATWGTPSVAGSAP